MSYEVQQYTLCEGWVNTWTVTDENDRTQPETFATREEAQAALDEFLDEIREEIETGWRPADNGYDRSEFRVVKTDA